MPGFRSASALAAIGGAFKGWQKGRRLPICLFLHSEVHRATHGAILFPLALWVLLSAANARRPHLITRLTSMFQLPKRHSLP